jgi:hypothetical protein
MALDTVTLDEVLRLARRLSPNDQARLRAALPSVTDEEATLEMQRQKNLAAIDPLDAWHRGGDDQR